MMKTGYVSIYRDIMKWEWYKDTTVKSIFLHLILRANHIEASCKGQIIKRGQLITSQERLAEELGLSRQQVRTGLIKLEKTQEITKLSDNKRTLITVNNYDLYQSNYNRTTNLPTNYQPGYSKKSTKVRGEDKSISNKVQLSNDQDLKNAKSKNKRLLNDNQPSESKKTTINNNNKDIKDIHEFLNSCMKGEIK